MKPRLNGYTLYEMSISLLLIGVLSAVAIPGFAKLHSRNLQRVEINTLFGAVHLARKESILKRYVATLCPSIDFEQCSGNRDWSGGWILFENKDRDSPARVDPGENILKRHIVSENISIRANRLSFTQRATFLRATNGTLVVCDRQNRIAPKALVISHTGRPRVADRTPRGDPYACAD